MVFRYLDVFNEVGMYNVSLPLFPLITSRRRRRGCVNKLSSLSKTIQRDLQ
jgi:hypothetical protein